jgi:hypothetical protein
MKRVGVAGHAVTAGARRTEPTPMRVGLGPESQSTTISPEASGAHLTVPTVPHAPRLDTRLLGELGAVGGRAGGRDDDPHPSGGAQRGRGAMLGGSAIGVRVTARNAAGGVVDAATVGTGGRCDQ